MTRLLRPRLADHVLARRHIVDGEARVVLHDTREGRLVVLGRREWGLLAAADGTRDVDGILLAAAREGAHARAPMLRGFLEQLDAAGMLADDAALEPPPTETAAHEAPSDRPIEPLPGFTLACDGSGSCCRLYASVLFGPVEAARARALMPEVQGGDRHELVFTPERGSAPTAGSAVALVDGRCAYLGGSGRCGLHALAGPKAKPTGCDAFPASFVDDGESVRVSVAVECACVLASVGRDDGSSIVPGEARARSELDPTLHVTELPRRLLLTDDVSAVRGDAVAWSRRLARRIDEGALTGDPCAALMALAEGVATHGLEADLDGALRDPPPLTAATLAPSIEALHALADERAREDAAWRSARDLAGRATTWIAEATAALADPDELARALRDDARRAHEVFYLRALLHGHALFARRPLARALKDRAVRVLVARSMVALFATRAPEELDPACAHPLALVEAMLRGHGLEGYVARLPGP